MTYLVPLSLLQLIVPAWSSLDPYVPFSDRWSDPSVWAGALLVLGLVLMAVLRPSRRACFVGTALACATAGPWIVIPLNVPLCEHRLYGVMLGMALVAGTVAAALVRRASSPGFVLRARWVAVGVWSVFGVLSATRSLEYRDERTLWNRALVLNPNSVRAYCGLGDCAGRRADRAETLRYSELAVALYPGHVAARRNVAEMNLQLGRAGRSVASIGGGRVPGRAMAEQSVLPPTDFSCLWLRLRSTPATVSCSTSPWTTALRCLDVAPPKGLVYRTAASARRRQGSTGLGASTLGSGASRGHDSPLCRNWIEWSYYKSLAEQRWRCRFCCAWPIKLRSTRAVLRMLAMTNAAGPSK